jgi:hypothetical protein
MGAIGRIAAFAAMLMLVGCTADVPDRAINPATQSSTKTAFPEITDWKSLRIQRYSLRGIVACGVPKVLIKGDGTVIFDDRSTIRIPQYKIRALVRKFQRARFFEADDSYCCAQVEDAGSTDISIAFDGLEKTVRLDGTGPSEMYALADAVDEAAGSADYYARIRRQGR